MMAANFEDHMLLSSDNITIEIRACFFDALGVFLLLWMQGAGPDHPSRGALAEVAFQLLDHTYFEPNHGRQAGRFEVRRPSILRG